MAASHVTWHGTENESLELLVSLSQHCACEYTRQGERTAVCSSHRLLEDQRALDGLVFARRIRATLMREELSR